MGSCIAQGAQFHVLWWPKRWDGGWEGGSGGRGYICIYIANSLCCIAETNTILQSNYTPIKKKLKKTTSSTFES